MGVISKFPPLPARRKFSNRWHARVDDATLQTIDLLFQEAARLLCVVCLLLNMVLIYCDWWAAQCKIFMLNTSP